MKKGCRTRCRAAHVEQSLETRSGGNATGKAAAPWSPGLMAMLPAISLLFLSPNQIDHHRRPALREAQALPEQGTQASASETPGRTPRTPQAQTGVT